MLNSAPVTHPPARGCNPSRAAAQGKSPNALLGALAVLAICSCGGGGGGSSSTTTPAPPAAPTKTGVLTDSPIQGVAFTTSTSLTGTTNALGQYTYRPGDTVQFKLGTLSLGSIPATGVITPIDLASGSANRLQNLLVLFQSLDSDGNPANGITIPAASAAALTSGLDLTLAPATFASASNTALQVAMTAGGISTPIVSAATANAAFLAEGMTLLSSHVWASSSGTAAVVLRAAPSGEYLLGEISPAEGGGMAGVEAGTVTFGGFDTDGYWINPAATTVDTNGQRGLSNPSTCNRLKVTGDTLLHRDDCSTTWYSIPRMENDPTGIVGAWSVATPGTIKAQLVLFFSNGTFANLDPIGNGGPGCGSPGVEFGTYSYNPSTKILKVSNITYNTDGCGGFSDSAFVLPAGGTLTLSGDGLTATVVDSTSTPSSLTVYRVSN